MDVCVPDTDGEGLACDLILSGQSDFTEAIHFIAFVAVLECLADNALVT